MPKLDSSRLRRSSTRSPRNCRRAQRQRIGASRPPTTVTSISGGLCEAPSIRSLCVGKIASALLKRRLCWTSRPSLPASSRQCELGSWTVSPNNKRVAFTVDFHGNREFRIFVRTLPAGQVVDEGIENAASNLVFAGDSETFFYVRNEPQTVRSYQLWRHRIGSDPTSDVLIYEEKDPTFSISLDLSKSRKFMLLNIEGEHTSEVRYLDCRSAHRRIKGH